MLKKVSAAVTIWIGFRRHIHRFGFVHHKDQLDLLNEDDTKAVNKKQVASNC